MSTEGLHSVQPQGWEQLRLIMPEAVSINLELGLVPRTDHLQWCLTVRDAVDGELLAMESVHHASLARARSTLAPALTRLLGALHRFSEPF